MAQVRSQNIVGRWCPSAGATGFRLIDRSGRGNHGTLTNMDPATDWVVSGGKGSLDLDATNDYVEMGVLNAINAGDVSFSFWYYPNSISGAATIFNNWSSTVVNVGFFCFRTGSQIAFQHSDSSFRVTTSVGGLSAGLWHHIVCTKASVVSGLRVWINGVLDGNSATPGSSQASTARFNFGGNYGGAGAPNCLMDDFIVYNVALNGSDVRSIYRLGRGYGIGPSAHRSRRAAAAGTNRRRRIICGGSC